MKDAYIAADFGGGSGRVIAGSLAGGRLCLEEIHRFPNRPVKIGNTLYWDFLSLFAEMKTGLRKAVQQGYRIKSVGIDTWGVDFGLIDKAGHLLGNPICYRDEGTAGYVEKFFENHDAEAHYAVNGTQVMGINTLFRLLCIRDKAPWMLDAAEHLLFMPDLFSYFLTGNAVNEYCISTTSELIDAKTGQWDTALIDECGFPRRIFGNIVAPGTAIGTIKAEIAEEIGADYPIDVIAVGSHDTASAVYAIERFTDKNTVFLSSGTWSLLGAVVDKPILTPAARAAGFTNEGAVGSKIRFLQNITGLWMLQRLVAQWEKEGKCADYPALIAEAERSGCTTVIDVDDPAFASAFDMRKAIDEYCMKHNLPKPQSRGDYVMTVCRSLAQRYKKGIESLDSLLPAPVERLVIMGGGGRNSLLTRLTQEATGLQVVTGPAEATAIGNILMQAKAAGQNPDETEL